MVNKKIAKGIKESKKSVYIKNYEGRDIYKHIKHGANLYNKEGVIPYSLELIKLMGLDFEVFEYRGRYKTNDVINISFDKDFYLDKTEEEIENLKTIDKDIAGNKDKISNIKKEISGIKSETKYNYIKQRLKNASKKNDEELVDKYSNEIMQVDSRLQIYYDKIEELKINNDSLKIDSYAIKTNGNVKKDTIREEFFEEGFKLKVGEVEIADPETGEVITEGKYIDYVMFKRSGSKARTGDVLFIKKELYDEMINWSRMYINFPTDKVLDVVGLSAYQSLVSSAIEDIVHIKSKNIFIIDDVDSVFTRKAKKVDKDKDGNLVVNEGEFEITNSLFDGQSLLDAKYFKEGQSMMLLRNHFFKSASFNTNIQKFFKDNGFKETKKLKDMFGNEVKVKDIHLIITPNSLKALKFEKFVEGGTKADMYNYWKALIDKEGCEFGVCKHEKSSKYGDLQRMSYQMLNSLLATKEDIKELANFEIEYINSLKNDIGVFKEYLIKNSNIMNCNDMFLALLADNPSEIVQTKIFKEFRSETISEYVRKVRSGKLRVAGDNVVLLGNPMLMLKHTVGQLKVENGVLDSEVIDETLKPHEDYVSCYNKIFNFNEELVGFRNPHTSPSNIARFNNTYNSNEENDIDKYFNLSKNIVAINSVKVEISDILGGSDFDSDFILLSNNKKLVEIAKKCFRKELVCLNGIPREDNKYMLTTKDMAKMDNKLAESKYEIGSVVNKGQLAMSTYYHEHNKKNRDESRVKELKEIVDIMTVLSGCAIDNAKRTYAVNISKYTESCTFKRFPKFWKFVSEYNNESKIRKIEANIEKLNLMENDIITKLKNEIKELKKLKLDCPMDFLQEVLDEGVKRAEETMPRSDGKINFDMVDLLIPKDKNKGRRDQKSKIIDVIEALDNKVREENVGISSDEDSKIATDILTCEYNEVIKNLSKKDISNETIYCLISEAFGQQKNKKKIRTSKLKLRLLNILFRSHPTTFSKAFRISKKEVA